MVDKSLGFSIKKKKLTDSSSHVRKFVYIFKNWFEYILIFSVFDFQYVSLFDIIIKIILISGVTREGEHNPARRVGRGDLQTLLI
jgi:hypothetical protein